jgi:hypothetical protein
MFSLPINARVFLAMILGSASIADEPAKSLRHAHAHNDYYHTRPLLDALDRGFNSVETDVFLVDGELLVGHDRHELRPERSLRKLYLEPLKLRVEKHGGYVHKQGEKFFLIDIKDNADGTREALGKLLGEYSSMVGRDESDKDAPMPAVTVVLSGAEPRRGIVVDNVRLAGADGRLSDLDSNISAAEMPVISDHWGQHFGWLGINTLPEEQGVRLREVTRKAHESGRVVRFWATLDSEHLWGTLLDNGVDLLNTDDLDRLARFLEIRDLQPRD